MGFAIFLAIVMFVTFIFFTYFMLKTVDEYHAAMKILNKIDTREVKNEI